MMICSRCILSLSLIWTYLAQCRGALDTTVNPPTTAEQQSDPNALEEDILCISVFGKCLNGTGTCREDRVFLKGMCGKSSNMMCCIPSQHEIKVWSDDDENCLNKYGECKLDTKSCTGTYEDLHCGGPAHRRCCIPDPEEAEKWKEDDTACIESLGVCQLDTEECSGEYQTGTCGGPRQRKCCLPGRTVHEKWEKNDGKCLDVWGKCQARAVKCVGSLSSGSCGGPKERQCCVPDSNTVHTWEELDKNCTLKYGDCQHSTKNCSGKLEQELCAGPYYRQCCIPDAEDVSEWEKDDQLCKQKNGVCQSVAMPCQQQYQEGLCGGRADVRQCCLAPVESVEISVNTEATKTKAMDKIMRSLSSHLTLVLSISIPAVLAMLLTVYCVVRRRTTCCRPYVKLRGDPRKTPWYKMEYKDMEEEDVNLTSHETDGKTYA